MAPMTTFSADENDYVSQEELNYFVNVPMVSERSLRHVPMFQKMVKDSMVKWGLIMMAQLKVFPS